jgi:hypothetical protein
MSEKYQLPPFLNGQVEQDTYNRWLHRKTQAILRRDRRRNYKTATGADYQAAIHSAVTESAGFDAYTGESLEWSLISCYDNEKSHKAGSRYKRDFAKLPTIDHVSGESYPAVFKICGWQTNDSKSDLEMDEFLKLCKIVLEHHGYAVTKSC